MQYYTKQQLQGAGRYTGKCRVGNWNEDVEMEETLLKDYLAKKESGGLKLDKFHSRMAVALAPVELAKVEGEGYVRYGDVMQLQASATDVLACDVVDTDPRPGENSCAVTVTGMSQPCARNTFVLQKAASKNDASFSATTDDSILRYGDKIKIVANPVIHGAADGPELRLQSKPVSTTHFAKMSHHQVVNLAMADTYDSTWCVLTPDPVKRLASEGVEVMAGAPLIFEHCATRQNLCCESKNYNNDFGQEKEVSAFSDKSNRACYGVQSMREGMPNNMFEKASSDSNVWVLMGAF